MMEIKWDPVYRVLCETQAIQIDYNKKKIFKFKLY